MVEGFTQGEIGTTGLNRFGGEIYEEFLTELQGQRGRRIYEEMSNNDAIVGAIIFAIEMALREVPWFVEPFSSDDDDKKLAQFLFECMHDCSHTWADFISEVLLMLPYGYSWFEIVYKKRDGKDSKYDDGLIGWRKFGYRAPSSLDRWEFDEAGGIQAFWQSCPPDFKQTRIPIEKSILFRTRKDKNNPEGRSILRTAYRPWYFKKNLEALEGISLERVYAGFPVIKLPKGASTGATASSDESKAKDIVRKVRVDEQMGLVLPDGWDFILKGPEGSRDLGAYDKSISRYRQEIMLSVLATFIALGVEKAGSYALARETRDFFQLALMGWLDNIKETLNQFAVPKLMILNGYDTATMPKIACGQVGQIDLVKMSAYIMQLVQAGALIPDEQLERYLREAADLPPRLEEKEKLEIGKTEQGEDWHPRIKQNPKALRQIQKVEGDLERSIRRFFLRQGEWIKDHWEELLPKGKSDIRKQTNPTDWDEWEIEFAGEIEKPTTEAMTAGATRAQQDVKGIVVDWSPQSPMAQKYLRDNGLKLAKGINETTKDRLRQVLLTGLKLGENRDQLARRVRDVIPELQSWRAKRIAQTEAIKAYNQGSLQVFESGGYKRKIWLDGQAEACDECEGLDGHEVGINENFPGGYDAPPAHPGCKCTIDAMRD